MRKEQYRRGQAARVTGFCSQDLLGCGSEKGVYLPTSHFDVGKMQGKQPVGGYPIFRQRHLYPRFFFHVVMDIPSMESYNIWLVVWNMNFIFPYIYIYICIGNNNPN